MMMSRNGFSLLILSALYVLLNSCTSLPTGAERGFSTRNITEMTNGWEFTYNDQWTFQDARGAVHSVWKPISVPHTWNRLGEYRVGRTTATDNRQGRGWYRRTINGVDLNPGKRHFIEFEAVGNVADIWLNGKHIGRHQGAFTRFRFELTDALDFGGKNILIVRADNSEPQPGSSTQNVIPLLGDFFIHGGIYRPARLISVAQSHIDLSDFGGPGLYATSKLLPDGSAEIDNVVRLTQARQGQHVHVALLDSDGKTNGQIMVPLNEAQATAEAMIKIENPRLWDGQSDPFLYRLVATLEEDGHVIDQVEQPFGLRAIRFDPDKGFFLNGKHLKLRGVSRHQDYLGQGWALSDADNIRDMEIIEDMGANSIRVAHYPQAEKWFETADRRGMIIWAEVPFVNKVAFGNAAASPELIANARMQMIELIRQNFNHPSIITWGIGNEVDIDLAFNRLGPKADARPLLRELNALAHKEDTSRPTVIADCCEATPGKKAEYFMASTGVSDLMGYNRYFGWYYGDVNDLGPHLDALHTRHPSIPISVSEYGAGGALTQHTDNFKALKTNATGRPQPEEFQSWWHEQSWPQIRSREYLWGSWIWNMFDFSSRVRQEGDATDINTKGLVSFDRKVKKDAFYYYKAHWSRQPVIHINSRRFTQRTRSSTNIQVYSNADKVAITLNDTSLGEFSCIDHVCVTDDVELSPGRNIIIASAMIGTTAINDSVEWVLGMTEK